METKNKSLSARIKRRNNAKHGKPVDNTSWVKTNDYGSYETDSRRVKDRDTERQRLNRLGISGFVKTHKNCKYADKHQSLH